MNNAQSVAFDDPLSCPFYICSSKRLEGRIGTEYSREQPPNDTSAKKLFLKGPLHSTDKEFSAGLIEIIIHDPIAPNGTPAAGIFYARSFNFSERYYPVRIFLHSDGKKGNIDARVVVDHTVWPGEGVDKDSEVGRLAYDGGTRVMKIEVRECFPEASSGSLLVNADGQQRWAKTCPYGFDKPSERLAAQFFNLFVEPWQWRYEAMVNITGNRKDNIKEQCGVVNAFSAIYDDATVDQRIEFFQQTRFGELFPQLVEEAVSRHAKNWGQVIRAATTVFRRTMPNDGTNWGQVENDAKTLIIPRSDFFKRM
ncbi:hypothetical protein HYU13_01500 [Candidatus Woesearchaeota archaeon]|nr:hypothetical protein [Candidatus Woesearchaeota archaeon]